MNTYAPNTVKRVLVMVLAAGGFAFAACGTETSSPQVATPVADGGSHYGQPYIRPAHPAGSPTVNPHAGEEVRAPRAMGGDPTLPTGTQPPRSVH